jgi:hypothetical protein
MTNMIEQLTGLPAHTVGFKMSGKLHQGLRITACLNYCPALAFVKG